MADCLIQMIVLLEYIDLLGIEWCKISDQAIVCLAAMSPPALTYEPQHGTGGFLHYQ